MLLFNDLIKRFLQSTCYIVLYKIIFCSSHPLRDISDLPKEDERTSGASTLLPFLKRFGYLESGNSSSHESDTLYTKESVEEALREMQKFGDLPQTGRLDQATLKLLTAPRCGLPDVIRENKNGTRKKRFVIGANGWNKRRLTYRVENWSPNLDESSVLLDLRKAFRVWADYARLRFVDKPRWNYDDVDISISFGRGHHGDRYPFDGSGGILAHAFFPYGHGSLGGDIHFDLDEDWRSNSNNEAKDPSSVSFFAVAVHEIGHSLGLGHSPSRDSVMFPYYQFDTEGEGEKLRLGYDDIMAMYQLYIQRNIEDVYDEEEPSTEKPTTEKITVSTKSYNHPVYPDSTTRATRPTYQTSTIHYSEPTRSTSKYTDSTTDGYSYSTEISTSISTEESSSFSPYWPTHTTTLSSSRGYPKTEKSFQPTSMPDLCKDGYDSISYIRNELFVFKNEYMWRFRKMGVKEHEYPVETARLFPMLKNVPKIDAALEDEKGRLYFFSGSKYWIFNENGEGFDRAFSLTDFSLPPQLHKIDGAFMWGKNKKTYFFSGNLFWRYNGTTSRMDEGYPKGIERWRGLPTNGIDSVMKWSDGRTYFFKNNDFWRFDDTLVQTDEGFPLSTSAFWFGC